MSTVFLHSLKNSRAAHCLHAYGRSKRFGPNHYSLIAKEQNSSVLPFCKEKHALWLFCLDVPRNVCNVGFGNDIKLGRNFPRRAMTSGISQAVGDSSIRDSFTTTLKTDGVSGEIFQMKYSFILCCPSRLFPFLSISFLL